MLTPKPEIRAHIRAARAARGPLPDVAPGHAASAEAAGVLASWRAVLTLLGTRAGISSPPSQAGPALDALPALFWPMDGEPDVRSIVAATPRALMPVVVSEAGRPLPEAAWTLHEGDAGGWVRPHARLPAHPWGTAVLGPETLGDATVILVAALGVDLSGTRVGQGAGWYDRALTWAAPGTPVVAAVFDDEVFPAATLPREPHDHPVDAVITPTRALLVGSLP